MLSGRSNTSTSSTLVTRAQSMSREVTRILPAPPVGKYLCSSSGASALSKTSSHRS
jgi:hypothetical protein